MRSLAAIVLVACSEPASVVADADADAGAEAGAPPVAVPDASADAVAAPSGWSSRASLPRPMQEVAVLALDGLVYVIGGFDDASATLADVRIYDPATDRWRDGVALPRPLHHVNAAVVGDRIWIAGALEGGAFTATGVTLMFDPGAGSWVERRAMPPGSERGSSMTAAIGETIYVAGGLRGGAVADFSAYDTETDTWSSLPPLPSARDHGGGVAAGGLFFAVSGRSSIAGHTTRLDVFDPATGAWTSRTPMPTSRAGSSIALAGDRIVVLGGEGNPAVPSGVFAEVEAYSIAADRWEALPAMPTPRHGTGAATIDGVVYVPGGGTRQGFGATAIVEALRVP
ncbi:MAG: kelch repeat-containing protein [Labilithrix sp.]|nr:kelch repeat-containing protein [Labilithrix sp.]MCW5810994.1 kelch repeat-containing protein [Labilithrix sp.]